MASKTNKAIIIPVLRGKYKGQFRFTLHGKNGEIVATSEHYTTLAKCRQTLERLFTNFAIIEP